MGAGNSTNKKDAQSNAARDFMQYLIRSGLVKESEVPNVAVSTHTKWAFLIARHL